MLAIVAIFAAAGDMLARTLDHHAVIAGALIGAFLGLLAGFLGVYMRYRDL